MRPLVKLRHGNLFDGPSDLIVLPCSTAGTITGFVRQALAQYSITHPRAEMLLGEVEIRHFEGADNIAQYVAFAASVAGYSSALDAIEEIGRELGKFTQSCPSVKQIAAPLLGTGAGRLPHDAVVIALKRGFVATSVADATLIVHVLHEGIYEHFRRHLSNGWHAKEQPIRVFISHTSKTDAAIEWVEALARYLIEHGIQARLDRFHLRRGMDLAQWMCNELAMAEKVIVVCDENYKAKAEGRLGGVGWETMLIQGDLANLPPDSTKYQVVVRAEHLEKGLPHYLRTRYAFHAPVTNDSNFCQELLKELLDLPMVPKFVSQELTL